MIVITSCKKKDIKPVEETPVQQCQPKKSEKLTGNYKTVDNVSDLLVISYVSTDCNNNNLNTYKITNIDLIFHNLSNSVNFIYNETTNTTSYDSLIIQLRTEVGEPPNRYTLRLKGSTDFRIIEKL